MITALDIFTIALSIPALVLCLLVLAHWLPEARRALVERRDAADWLVVGVAVSFTGIAINIVWWAAFMTLRLLDLPGQEWWLDHGSLINLFSRQGAVIIAAWCHLWAYKMFNGKKGGVNPNTHLLWTLGAAGIVSLTLFIVTGAPNG